MNWDALVPWLLLVLGAVAALVGHYAFWTRRLSIDLPYESVERLATRDGTFVEIRRIPGRVPTFGVPVLLVHGVGIDHRNTDMLPGLSLARHLRDAGRDVWLLRLRSGGLVRGFRGRRRVRFAAMAEHDVPLGVSAVLAHTGARRLDYVGFSMGGMLLYAALGAGWLPPDRVRRVVTIGSPARVGEHVPFARPLARLPRCLVPPLPLRWLSRMLAFAVDWIRTPMHRFVYNPDNVDRGVAGRAMMAIQDIPSALNADFLSFVRRGGVLHLEGRDVLGALERLRIPALFFAGEADRIATVSAVRLAFDAWGASVPSVHKRFVLLAAREGAAADYGHGDLAIGRSLQKDVFAPIRSFLENDAGVEEERDAGADDGPREKVRVE